MPEITQTAEIIQAVALISIAATLLAWYMDWNKED